MVRGVEPISIATRGIQVHVGDIPNYNLNVITYACLITKTVGIATVSIKLNKLLASIIVNTTEPCMLERKLTHTAGDGMLMCT